MQTNNSRKRLLGVLICVLASLFASAKAQETAQSRQAYDLAMQLGQAGRYSEAVARMEQACTLDPTSFYAAYNLGVMGENAKDAKAAFKGFQRAVQLDAGSYKAWVGLGQSYADLGDQGGALKVFQMCAQRFPGEHRRLNLAMGSAFAKQGKWKQASDVWEKARAAKPDDEQIYLLLHSAYTEQGKLDADLKIQKEFVARFPNSKYQQQMADAAKYYEKDFARTKTSTESGRGSDDHELWKVYDMPLKVYVNDRLKGRTVWTAGKANGSSDTFSSLIEQAWNEWASASSGHATFVICDNPDDANIICDWTDDYSKFALSFAAGETLYGRNKHGRTCCTLHLLTAERDKKPVSKPMFYNVTLHELGHALGLGHSPNVNDVMYFSALERAKPHLSTNDVARVRQVLP